MLIFFDKNELLGFFKDMPNLNYLKGVAIDYADNSLHTFFENVDYKLINLKDYGVYLDNRYNSYSISVGDAGILLKIVSRETNDTFSWVKTIINS